MPNQQPKVSFEFFPPNSEEKLVKLLATAQQFAPLTPDFFSVTYGAGGSTKENTKYTVFRLAQNFKFHIVPHISCVGTTKHDIKKLLDEYRQAGINHLVTIRGDLPSGMCDRGEFNYANDLIAFIRAETGDHFQIKVAAYPEFHPEAKTSLADLNNLKRKVDQGASAAITQYFFNSDAYFHFRDDCQRLGINIPIIPGIMPISNWEKLVKFSKICGTELPTWLCKRMDSFAHDANAIRDYSCEVVTKLCERLLYHEVKELHFYTLNQASLALKICANLNLL
jgi:methylenetetrahydrofolate reductase (NADPH)